MSQRSVHVCDGCHAELPEAAGQPSNSYFGLPGWAKFTISQPVAGVFIAAFDFCPRCTARVVAMFELPPPDPAPQPPWLKPVG